jgi:3-isopropylmalate dehydratase small subunit
MKTKKTFTNYEKIEFAVEFAQHCLNKVGYSNIECVGEMLEFEKNYYNNKNCEVLLVKDNYTPF